MLKQYGWKDVRPLGGGFEAWRAAGSPLESKAGRTESLSEAAKNLRDAEGDQDVTA